MSPQIVRTWTGTIRTSDRAAYAEYLEQTGMHEYRETAGNLAAHALYRDLTGTTRDGEPLTEVVTWSLWDSMDSIRGFAGDDPSAAVFYPEDDRYLIARELTVKHFDVVG